MNDQELLNQFQTAIANLLWLSEADYPWEVNLWEDIGELSPEKILEKTGHDSETPIEVVELEKFFSYATQSQSWHNEQEKEDIRRYQALVKSIKEHLTNIQVYRVGLVEIDIYVIGQTQSGNFLILATKSVET
jgi:hypothetical protein